VFCGAESGPGAPAGLASSGEAPPKLAGDPVPGMLPQAWGSAQWISAHSFRRCFGGPCPLTVAPVAVGRTLYRWSCGDCAGRSQTRHTLYTGSSCGHAGRFGIPHTVYIRFCDGHASRSFHRGIECTRSCCDCGGICLRHHSPYTCSFGACARTSSCLRPGTLDSASSAAHARTFCGLSSSASSLPRPPVWPRSRARAADCWPLPLPAPRESLLLRT
jgi:hypothetical protein